MIKRLLFLSLFFGLVDVVFISCCKDSLLDYTKFNSINLSNTSLKNSLPDSSTVSQANFRIKLRINGEFIAQRNSRPSFLNNSYATSCANMGLNGLKSDIVRLEMTCNKEILGVPSGQKLNLSKVKVYEFGYYDDAKNKKISLNEWLNILNNGRFEQSGYELYFEFEDPIISNEFLKFKVVMEFQDGVILEAETNNVRVT